jgi:hypothetical protein
MKTFDVIEREAFHELEKLQTSINTINDANGAAQDILARLSEELCLTEPVNVSILTDDSGSLFYSSANPIAAYVIALAENADIASRLNDQITDHQCRSLVSFPERLANKISNMCKGLYTFNSELYWERLCDTTLYLCFTKPQHSEACVGVSIAAIKMDTVVTTIITLLLRRGNLGIVVHRLFLLPQDLFRNTCFREHFSVFLKAVFDGCTRQRFSLKARKEVGVSQVWHQWNVQMLMLVIKRPDLKKDLINAVCEVINDVSDESAEHLSCALFDSLFVDSFVVLNSSRSATRIIFKDVLPAVAGGLKPDNVFSFREQICFTALFNLWSNKEFVKTGSLSSNLNFIHPIMYALLYIKRKNPEHEPFPQKYVGALLNGVSIRLDSTRGAELRECAMTVAAAFATLFVSDTDGAASLTQDANYARALESWMKDEIGSDSSSAPTSINMQQAVKETSQKAAAFARRSVAFRDTYPLNPEEPFTFFLTLAQRSHRDLIKKAQQDVALPASPDAFMPSALPAFGQQKYAKDELSDHVSIMRSVRECYNAILGVGRGPNAQMHEVQEAAESGLRGLADAFAKLGERIGSDLFKSVSKEIGPLIPTFLPALISLSIHAPDEEKQFLQQLRYEALVDIIALNPLHSLNQLSGMLYRSNYGIYQRNELIKAIGEAALLLSKVEIKDAAPRFSNERDGVTLVQETKRIYPPIPTHQLSGEQKTAIVVSEGRQTRRWGNANVERSQRRAKLKHYNNLLSEVAAAFVAAFLLKLDADHFAFFQESDPYTPCAILDSLTIVFQGITNVRHIAPDLCEKNFDFFFAVCTKHPNLTVKQAAWTSIVEVMRTWCGASPLWVRQRDGQRVLNRNIGLHHSLMLTKNWLNALEMLQHTCEKMIQSNDACSRTAFIAVSSLRDLVYDCETSQFLSSRSEGISLSD